MSQQKPEERAPAWSRFLPGRRGLLLLTTGAIAATASLFLADHERQIRELEAHGRVYRSLPLPWWWQRPWMGKLISLPAVAYRIDLRGEAVDDAFLRKTRPFQRITTLDLQDTEVTDAVLESITSFPNLDAVSLSGTHVTPQGIARLQHARPDLWVYRCYSPQERKTIEAIAGAGAYVLARHDMIVIAFEPRSTGGCGYALPLDQREWRPATPATYGDASLALLKQLDQITSHNLTVIISGHTFTDESLQTLQFLKHLATLHVRDSIHITGDAIEQLRQSRPEVDIQFRRSPWTDLGVPGSWRQSRTRSIDLMWAHE